MATDEGELELLMEFSRRGVTYPIRRYPRIREFARLLTRGDSGRVWTGRDFGAETTAEAEGTIRVYLRGRSGIVISFASEEWNIIKSLFEQVMTAPEVQSLLDELTLRYGEI